MKFFKNKKILVGIIIFVCFVVFLLATGVLKFNFSVRRTSENPVLPTSQTPQVNSQTKLLADRASTFGGTIGKPTFSVFVPLGWSKGDNPKVALVVGSEELENLSNNQTFRPNINFIIAKHEIAAKSIKDYASLWKPFMSKYYPSSKFNNDYTKKVGNFDVYVLDGLQTRADGSEIHQIQYIFWIDENLALAAVGSAPSSVWNKYEKAIIASIESVKLEKVAEVEKSGSPSAVIFHYSNDKFGVSLDYPVNWTKKDGSEEGTQDKALVEFFPPKNSKTQTANVIIEDLSANPLTLEKYTESMLTSAKDQVKNINFLESKETQFGGLPGYRIIVSGDSSPAFSSSFKSLMTWTVKGNLAYVFTYNTDPAGFDEFFNVAEQMISSLKIK